MTKSDLIDVLCETRKMPKGRAELLVNVIFDSMEATLRRGERIEIRGFGSFEIRNYRAYEGRNPRTGATVNVRPKRLPFFKVGKELKERVNDAAAAATARNGASSNGTNGAPPAAPSSANGGNGNGVPDPSTQLASGPVSSTANTPPVETPPPARSASV
jgi:integration host factor subunit beta